jgi:hypothetical protein
LDLDTLFAYGRLLVGDIGWMMIIIIYYVEYFHICAYRHEKVAQIVKTKESLYIQELETPKDSQVAVNVIE